MDFADEHYVKLFTRDTVTWKLWPWQAKCLLPLMERKVDAAGFIDCADADPAVAVQALVEIPLDVVAPGLAAMIKSGTVEVVGTQVLLVNFVAAQESRKTDKAKARDYRERKKAKARADAPPASPAVTARHRASPAVTPTNPPALLCPALPVPELLAPRKKRAPAAKEEKPPDPRHAPLRHELERVFREETHDDYPFAANGGRNAKAIATLLALGIEPTILAAWRRALREKKFPKVRMLWEFVENYAHFVGEQINSGPDPNTGILGRDARACARCGGVAEAQLGGVWLCYGECLSAGEQRANETNPTEPWTVDLTQWASEQRNGAAA